MSAVTNAVILEYKKNKIYHHFCFFFPTCHEVMGLDVMILVFWMLSFKPAFSLSSFTLINSLLAFYQQSGVIYISEAVDISPSNLDSSLWFIRLSILNDLICI